MRVAKFLVLGVMAIAGLSLGSGIGATTGKQSTAPALQAGAHVRNIVIRDGAQRHVRMPDRVKRLLRAADEVPGIRCPGATTTTDTPTEQTCVWPTTFAGSVTCIQVSTSPIVTQTCDATQTQATGNIVATIIQVIFSNNPPSPQDGTQIVKLRQTNTGPGSIVAGIAQAIKQSLGPGTPNDTEERELEPNASPTSSPITQKQESHQIVHLRQVSVSGKIAAPIFQFLRQRERAGNAPEINQFQNTDDRGLCVKDESDGLPPSVSVDANANMCILLNQVSASGPLIATLTGDYQEFQRARKTLTGQQIQGNLTPFLGGEDYGLKQSSTGLSNILTIQHERQVQRAVGTGTLTQSQNGPRKGEGSTQETNPNDTWRGFQTSTQIQTNRLTPALIGTPQSTPGTQKTFLLYSAATSGIVNATQAASQNGQSTSNSCSGTTCEILIIGENGTFAQTCPEGTFFDPVTQKCEPIGETTTTTLPSSVSRR